MQGLKSASRKLGVGAGFMPAHDPDAVEGVCPLCGEFDALNRMGYCYDRSCKDAVKDRLKALAVESGGTVEGKYYKVGQVELINLAAMERFAEPVSPIKHPDLCSEGDCDVWARPRDTLCPTHRLKLNQAQADSKRRIRQGKAKRTKGRNHRIGNGIRGLRDFRLEE